MRMEDNLKRAIAWVRREMIKRTKEDHSHPSHIAAKVLNEADERFALGSCGVEGWITGTQNGVQYLNFGDPYVPTLVVRTYGHNYRCSVGGWASYA
jgi:hypothetical protein